jgi:hypothetical protein
VEYEENRKTSSIIHDWSLKGDAGAASKRFYLLFLVDINTAALAASWVVYK